MNDEGTASVDSRSSCGRDVINGEEDSDEMKSFGGLAPGSEIPGRTPKVGIRGVRVASKDGSKHWLRRSKRFMGRNVLGGTDTACNGNWPSFPGT